MEVINDDKFLQVTLLKYCSSKANQSVQRPGGGAPKAYSGNVLYMTLW